MLRSSSARRAPASTTTTPVAGSAKAIHSLRAASRFERGCTTVPTPETPRTASCRTPSRSAAAITVRTPDHAAMRAAASFDAIPPLPRAEPAPPDRHLPQRPVDLEDLLDQRRFRVEARIGGEDAGGVGEEHQQVGADEVREEGGDAVVVAEAQAGVGQRVVLVDDRHHAQLQQAPQRGLGLQVLSVRSKKS